MPRARSGRSSAARSRAREVGRPRRVIGVDTGGTFTDVVCLDGDEVRVDKLSSTPADPAEAVLAGVGRALTDGADGATAIVHGTTVALNALLTGRLARTALVTNEGFRDLIEIGRQDRPELYALHPCKPAPLAPRALRFELAQRTWPDPDDPAGAPVEVRRPKREELARLVAAVRRARPESVAVCLLHAYADPAIEERVARALAPLGVPVTCSAGLLREYREVERFSTALANAALVPLMSEYLGGLERRLARGVGAARLAILQSSGGTLDAARAAREPVRVLFSGPAGGVVGAARAAREAGFERLVGLDMGGTSTDVCFHDGRAGAAGPRAGPVRVAGHPIAVPSLDLHTIGCGGGSLVRVDAGGVLHVGPESAGADPGPVCYGRGDTPTVTDAHALLGHLRPGRFLGGELPLDLDAVERAFAVLARRLGTSPRAAAQGVLDVARAAMRRAVGVMTMQRGEDPAALLLVAFGGAGGLHAAALAESLRMPRALVPRWPGLLSAWGMATADAVREASETVLAPLARFPARRRSAALRALLDEARAQLLEDGLPAGAIEAELELDLRYAGQSFEVRVPDRGRADPGAAFHKRHEELYGYALPEREVELVTLRARALARRPARRLRRPRARALPEAAVVGQRALWLGRRVTARVLDRELLPPGASFRGPAVVEELSGTTLVPPGWTATVTAGAHLLLEHAGPARRLDGRGARS